MKFISKKIIWMNGVIFLFIIWFIASKYNWIDSTLLASPSDTFSVILNSFKPDAPHNQQLFAHATETISVAFKGWGITLVLGILLGLLFGYIEYLMKSFEIVIEFFRAIPPILAFPLMLIAFNFETSAYIWTIVFGCLPIMVLTVSKGIQHISKSSVEILEINKISPINISLVKSVEMLPSIFLGARLTFSFSLIIIVVSEMIFTPKSGFALGALARDAEINFETPTFYAVIIIIGLFGFFINLLLNILEKKFKIK